MELHGVGHDDFASRLRLGVVAIFQPSLLILLETFQLKIRVVQRIHFNRKLRRG